jgi:glycosyltransferase involved in cell wall biosynthesis
MKVLHLCPLWFPVAIDAAGGIETFVAQLVHALEQHGCRNTVIASGDSSSAAELIPAIETNAKAMVQAGSAWQYEFYEQHQLRLALERADEFDIIHSHIGPAAYVLSSVAGLQARVLHTVHSQVYRDMEWFAGKFPELSLVTVSQHQARKLQQAGAQRCEVVHNGIDFARYLPQRTRGGDLLFIGRIEWGKGPELALQAARRLGWGMTLAGPIVDRELFEREIEPFLGEQHRYVGIVDHATKNRLFAQADCAVLPFRRDEPFGMVALEAMACGTPVVCFADGALPEIVEPGVTGFLAALGEPLDGWITRAATLDRARVRSAAQARFDIDATARRYLQTYRRMLGGTLLDRGALGEEAHA